MYLREQFMLKGEELDVKDMAKEIYMKVTSLYFKANAKLIPPVIMSETVAVQKIVRSWSDTNTVIWKQKNNNIVKKRLELRTGLFHGQLLPQGGHVLCEGHHLQPGQLLSQEDHPLYMYQGGEAS